jgi:hypothetical protein
MCYVLPRRVVSYIERVTWISHRIINIIVAILAKGRRAGVVVVVEEVMAV